MLFDQVLAGRPRLFCFILFETFVISRVGFLPSRFGGQHENGRRQSVHGVGTEHIAQQHEHHQQCQHLRAYSSGNESGAYAHSTSQHRLLASNGQSQWWWWWWNFEIVENFDSNKFHIAAIVEQERHQPGRRRSQLKSNVRFEQCCSLDKALNLTCFPQQIGIVFSMNFHTFLRVHSSRSLTERTHHLEIILFCHQKSL